MDANQTKSPIKMISQRRFTLDDYEFVCGGDHIKSCLNQLMAKHGKRHFAEDPSFDIHF